NDEDEIVDAGLIQRRLARAVRARQRLAADPQIEAHREVHAESDGLPGLIVDRYGSFRVVQFLSAGAERWREAILAALANDSCSGIFERSDAEARVLEGLEPKVGLVWGEPPPSPLMIEEYGLSFAVDVQAGHKTGFYLDQRENRLRVRGLISGGQVLDVFSYTGGFTVNALAGGADRVTAIESSSRAIQLAKVNLEHNKMPAERVTWIQGDAFVEMRRLRDRGLSFDAIILDPPRFAATRSQVHRAARGYKDINLLAFKLLKPGGRLFTFSCSGGLSSDLFQKIVADAALDAGVGAVIEGWMSQAEDHPVALHFPEGRYLKGLICRQRK
ncbi:MAG TPA: class I SAM-dependent rRNA methyltransferase, partial [Chloroflexi bacterium]|nr:class I SAM-dependent rRNA methyltransferase [Chloroflexota bacterium]